jgi:cytochrome c-type biogenesis protein CcmH/NrfG
MRAYGQALDSAERTAQREPGEASAWERVGRLRLRRMDRGGALAALERARGIGASASGLLDLALAYHLVGDVGGEVSACEAATRLAPDDSGAWSRYAHALARTERTSDCLAACARALELEDDPEVRNLRDQVLAAQPRELSEPATA